MLVEEGGCATSHTIRWALDNAGPVSWRINRERYLSGAMSEREEKVHLRLRELGLIASVAYAMPILPTGIRSAFGLCFRPGMDQEDADRIWAK